MNKQQILVTGASGTIGSELVKRLAEAGHSVRAGYRSRRPNVSKVQPVQLDLTTGEGLDSAVAGVDSIFLSLCQYIRGGEFPKRSTAIKDVTDRDPISFDQFARDYAEQWRKQ